jgi:hypothetical protein
LFLAEICQALSVGHIVSIEVQYLLVVFLRGATLRRDGMATDAERAALIG